ncbi:hypothetical protein INR49_019856 [Caranx melampygus]|nr:hypothetical protein INR49_019856 [Caranx melampygus]
MSSILRNIIDLRFVISYHLERTCCEEKCESAESDRKDDEEKRLGGVSDERLQEPSVFDIKCNRREMVEEPGNSLTLIHQCAEKHHDVDRSEAEQKAEENHCQQLANPFTFLLFCGLVGFHSHTDPPGGKHHQDNRNNKAQEEAHYISTSQIL